MHNRYYDPRTGAFLSEDPIAGRIGGGSARWNAYSYVNGNPVNFTDPDGCFPTAIIMAVGISMAIDYGMQRLGGCTHAEVDWGSVYLSGAIGGVSGGIGAGLGGSSGQ